MLADSQLLPVGSGRRYRTGRIPESRGRSRIRNPDISTQKCAQAGAEIQRNPVIRGFGWLSAPNQRLNAEFGSMEALSRLGAGSKLGPGPDKFWSAGRPSRSRSGLQTHCQGPGQAQNLCLYLTAQKKESRLFFFFFFENPPIVLQRTGI